MPKHRCIRTISTFRDKLIIDRYHPYHKLATREYSLLKPNRTERLSKVLRKMINQYETGFYMDPLGFTFTFYNPR